MCILFHKYCTYSINIFCETDHHTVKILYDFDEEVWNGKGDFPILLICSTFVKFPNNIKENIFPRNCICFIDKWNS